MSLLHDEQAFAFTRVRKRSREEIYLDVLRLIRNGVQRPTQIMYKANLSWVPVDQILSSLVLEGMVKFQTEKGGRKLYFLTEKGQEVINSFLNASKWKVRIYSHTVQGEDKEVRER